MKKCMYFSIFSIALASATLNIPPVLSAELIKSQPQKELTLQKTNPKISQFLAFIKRAKSAKEIHKAYERANFTENEIKELRILVAAEQYKYKLEKLFNKESKKSEVAAINSSKAAANKRMKANLVKRQKSLIEVEQPITAIRQKDDGKNKEMIKDGPAKPIVQKTPVIKRLSSHTITPDQVLNISGQYFGALSGKVFFTIQGKKYDGNIEFWRDDLISVRLKKGIAGVKRTHAVITLSNNFGRSVNYSINFIPELVERHIYKSWTLTIPAPAPWETKRTKTYCDCRLQNDWEVAEYWKDAKTSGKAGCSYREEPSVGGNSPKARIKLWAYGFSGARCTHNVLIRGPKGFKPYDDNCCS